MTKNDTRERIVREGAGLIHRNGYSNTGIQEILDAAGVPKGSFYFYFKNKEDFGCAVIDYVGERIVGSVASLLEDRSVPPMERLDRLFDRNQRNFERMKYRYGCPVGNMMQEMADLKESFRDRIEQVYTRLCASYEACLREGQERGDFSRSMDPGETSEFMLNSLEGAIMHMKLTKNERPLVACRKFIHETLSGCRITMEE